MCEILNKPDEKFKTKVIDNCSDPNWNHSAELKGYQPGDVLVLRIYDSDSKPPDDFLGSLSMKSDQFFPHGFDGELPLDESGTRVPAKLKLKIASPVGCRPPETQDKPSEAVQPTPHAKRKPVPSIIEVEDSAVCSVEA